MANWLPAAVERLIRPLWLFLLGGLLLTTGSRLGLMSWQMERITDASTALTVLGFGIRIDLVMLCYWLIPAVLLLLPLPSRYHRTPLYLWLAAGFGLLAFMEAVTPGFIAQYDLRPNRLFVEYLQYPQEVFGMLLGGFQVELVFGLLVLLAAPYLAYVTLLRFAPSGGQPVAIGVRLAVIVLLLPLLVLGARGTLRHRPINPGFTAFSSDALLNDLTLNSLYSVAWAVRALRAEIDASRLYPQLPDAVLFTEVRKAMGLPEAQFLSARYPTWHAQKPSVVAPRLRNLVIVLEESLGAQYVGTLGGDTLTPSFDALAETGWLLEELYATGTRSVRGIEAAVTGFLPTPARSVVKLPRSQQDFFTLASLFGTRGYDTSFIYGGEGHFDNMASFFLGNGFHRVVDRRHYDNPEFTGSWGVSDGDLMRKAHDEFTRLHAEGKPFFSLVFSSSNHTPYDYPVDAITPVEQPPNTKRNAIRYADHALGEFFALARDSDYWDDTLFLVVADHDDRVFGRQLVPIEHFRIPGLILGKGITPRRDPRVFSQIDLPPTLLSLLGIASQHPMLGRDITTLPEAYEGRAIMQYGANQAYWRGQEVVVTQPERPVTTYRMDREHFSLMPAPANPELEREALAHALWGSLAYRRGLYPPSINGED
ncbi:LTA synthase family protein [Haliea sp.]|jgi:phosphoglycerol transferase MdoB-like AlkP superfamily enzyme|uniref:LTA synthase family protein n=1 Tax=Haliea sp. TaxID=1932666 RepID=UPI00257F57F2|nr:LTA synthase family protein [Haliea sp.]|tara:strand:- start:3336 stop:5288 length:1953 start_codon:yes stop_codon:yes gene_type:complete